jgi:hypothetical protein
MERLAVSEHEDVLPRYQPSSPPRPYRRLVNSLRVHPRSHVPDSARQHPKIIKSKQVLVEGHRKRYV